MVRLECICDNFSLLLNTEPAENVYLTFVHSLNQFDFFSQNVITISMPQLSKMKENLVQNTFCLSPYEIQESQKDMIFTLELFHKFRGAFSGTSNSVYQVLFLRLIFWPKKGCWGHKGVHLEKNRKAMDIFHRGGLNPMP